MSKVTTIHGDCLLKLRDLAAESVQCCVTSPPYWGLRDYGVPPSIFGGEEGCEHEWKNETIKTEIGKGNWTQGTNGRGELQPGGVDAKREPIRGTQERGFCTKCGAWRGCHGLEPTPELYVAHSVAIFREVRRVLRRDATLWVNLGDSFAGGGNGGGGSFAQDGIRMAAEPGTNKNIPHSKGARRTDAIRKPGDLVGIPWMVAFALQADGWYLRRDNIWHKPAPMPESVNGVRWERCRVKTGREKVDWKKVPKGWDVGEGAHDEIPDGNYRQHGEREATVATYEDCHGCPKCAPNDGLVLRRGNWRCTTAHEYVFQFSKSKDYFCDAEAAKEPTSGTAHPRGHGVNPKAKLQGHNGSRANESFSGAVNKIVGTRNRRSVWTINTKGFPGAHFATFPAKLIEPIIRCATPPKACGKCGAPYAPVVERGEPDLEHQRACGGDANGHYQSDGLKDYSAAGVQNPSSVKARILAGMVSKTVASYRATCACGAEAVPSVVLDPFGGSGTVGMVANNLGRDAILIEIADHYLPLIAERTGTSAGHLPLHLSTAAGIGNSARAETLSR